MYDSIGRAGAARQRAADARRIMNTQPSLRLEQYAGTYSDSLYGTRRVIFENGGLRLRYSPSYAATLEHWQYETFRARPDDPWAGSGMVTFIVGPAGVPSRLEAGGVTFRRVQENR